MKVELVDDATGGRYVLRLDRQEAEMTFSKAGRTMTIIDHTGAPEALRGQGVDEAMV